MQAGSQHSTNHAGQHPPHHHAAPPAHPGPPERWLPRLLRLLDEQLACAEQLDSLSQQQGELVGVGDASGVLGVLMQRQPLVDRLVQLSQESRPLVERMGELLAALKVEDRQAVMSRVARADELIESVNTRDRMDHAALEHLRKQVGDELASLGKGRDAVAAYGQSGTGPGPAFQDRQG